MEVVSLYRSFLVTTKTLVMKALLMGPRTRRVHIRTCYVTYVRCPSMNTLNTYVRCSSMNTLNTATVVDSSTMKRTPTAAFIVIIRIMLTRMKISRVHHRFQWWTILIATPIVLMT